MKRVPLLVGLVIGLGACAQTTSPKQQPPPGSGGNLYVDVANGDDGAAGDSAHPFQTIQHAADLVNPGDVVVVRNGVYTGGNAIFDVARGGTARNPVVFRAANRWGAVLDGRNNTSEDGVHVSASFVRIEGFEIKGVFHDGIIPSSGIIELQIVGNNIHDVGRYCETGSIGLSAIGVANDNVVIEQNLIHDIGRYADGENGCSQPNDYWQNHDHGVYVSSGTNVIIRNNVFYNIARGWAIHCYPGPISQVYIANNTFAFPNPYRDGHIIVGAALTTAAIVNNIFYQPQTAGVAFDVATTSAVTVEYNLTMGGTVSTGSGPGVTFSHNIDNVDPMLANAPAFDFQLVATSPAIDAGVTLPYVSNDFLGTSRPQGVAYDIGAFEFH